MRNRLDQDPQTLCQDDGVGSVHQSHASKAQGSFCGDCYSCGQSGHKAINCPEHVP